MRTVNDLYKALLVFIEEGHGKLPFKIYDVSNGLNDIDKLMRVNAALLAGFMVSTAYGQEENKLMPVSDYETLKAF